MDYIDVIKWWQSKQIISGKDLLQALDNFRIVFATNSNSIEGNRLTYHNTKDIFENKTLSLDSISAREIFEAQNQKFAFNKFIEYFNHKEEINIDMILELHRIMLYGCYDNKRWEKGERPGSFKKHDYAVGIGEIGSFPEDVKGDIEELILEVNETKTKDILMAATYLHARFETIHPFADGNGRIGRLLLNYYLVLNNYPPIVIFNEDKETYYLALEVYDRVEQLDNFEKFLQEQLVKTWKNRLEPLKRRALTELDTFNA